MSATPTAADRARARSVAERFEIAPEEHMTPEDVQAEFTLALAQEFAAVRAEAVAHERERAARVLADVALQHAREPYESSRVAVLETSVEAQARIRAGESA